MNTAFKAKTFAQTGQLGSTLYVYIYLFIDLNLKFKTNAYISFNVYLYFE